MSFPVLAMKSRLKMTISGDEPDSASNEKGAGGNELILVVGGAMRGWFGWS